MPSPSSSSASSSIAWLTTVSIRFTARARKSISPSSPNGMSSIVKATSSDTLVIKVISSNQLFFWL